jgi:carbon storage regulator
MLVLSRKKNDSVVIDGQIRITVLEVRGNTVRLGIEAPKDVPIYRSELLERIESRQLPGFMSQCPTDALTSPCPV